MPLEPMIDGFVCSGRILLTCTHTSTALSWGSPATRPQHRAKVRTARFPTQPPRATTTLPNDSQPKSLWGGRTAESVAESPHQAAIATPEPAPVKPMVIAEPWGESTTGLPSLPDNESNEPF